MRKLKLQVQMTVDGFIAGPNNEMDWVAFDWDDELKRYVTALTEPVDCIVLGRNLAQGFIPHWASQPEEEGAEKINSTPKIAFTKTLKDTEWANTVLAKGDLVEEITNLKQQTGGDLIAYGGATFVSALIKHNLIDEYHLLVNPAAIGIGMPIFDQLDRNRPLTLAQSKSFACGIVVLHYEPKRNE
ncbi:dihydrofolate reductase family protein [Spirosoma fluminis]